MKKITIRSTAQKYYTIFVGLGLLEHIPSIISCDKYADFIIITGNNTPSNLVKKVNSTVGCDDRVITFIGGEKNKTIETVQLIWKKLHDYDCIRKSLIINIGGGIVTDIGGFCASTYLKGIDYVNIPTTLLGQVDASNGGKTGINFGGVKNLIGSFQPPIGVIADINCLSTLPKREFIGAFGEIIKHGLIKDSTYFQLATSKQPENFTRNELVTIIERSCEIKANVVKVDVKESGRGKILNFGHTFGHAIEVVSQKSPIPILHGEGVLFGMMVETTISYLLGLLAKKDYDMIVGALRMIGIPKYVHSIPIQAVLKTVYGFARYTDGVIRCTLLTNIGHAVVNIKVPRNIVTKALRASI